MSRPPHHGLIGRVTRPRELSWLRALACRIEAATGPSTSSHPLAGRQNAALHLKWLREAVASSPLAKTRPASHARRRLARSVDRHVSQHEPLAYIIGPLVITALAWWRCRQRTGTQPFGELDLDMRPPVLIPRSEVRCRAAAAIPALRPCAQTEEWAVRLAERLAPLLTDRPAPLRVLEVGSGSGCIALLLAARLPANSAIIYSIDIDPAAHALAQHNARKVAQQLGNPVQFELADAFDVAPPFDLLVSNPPYIPAADHDRLPPSVREWESRLALVGEHAGDKDGLAFYRRLATLVDDVTAGDDGLPIFAAEIDEDQAEAVRRMLSQGRMARRIEVWQDYAGKDRVVLGFRR
jgi:HemK-like putative methylase